MDSTGIRGGKTMDCGGEEGSRNKMLSNKKDLTAENMGRLTKLKEESGRLKWVKLNPDICQGQVI